MRCINLYAKPYKPMCFELGFNEALLGLLNWPIAKEVRCLDLQFHLESFELMMILRSLWTTQLYTFILYRACIFPFPPLFSFTISKTILKMGPKFVSSSLSLLTPYSFSLPLPFLLSSPLLSSTSPFTFSSFISSHAHSLTSFFSLFTSSLSLSLWLLPSFRQDWRWN